MTFLSRCKIKSNSLIINLLMIIQKHFYCNFTDDDKSTDGDSIRNSLYTSQGAIPKANLRQRNDISSRFGGRVFTDGVYKTDKEHSVQMKATDMIEAWTWGNQPGNLSVIF